jgi:hypothetical protein
MKLIQSQHQSIEGNKAIDLINIDLLEKEIKSTYKHASDLREAGCPSDAEDAIEGLMAEYEQLIALDPENDLLIELEAELMVNA